MPTDKEEQERIKKIQEETNRFAQQSSIYSYNIKP